MFDYLRGVSKAIGGGVATGALGAAATLAFANDKIPGAQNIPWWGQIMIAAGGFLGGFVVGFATTYAFPANGPAAVPPAAETPKEK